MAAFTDQFERRSPLAPDMPLSLSMHIRTALSGSIVLLGNRTAQEVAQVARAIDATVAREAKRMSAKLEKSLPSSLAKRLPAESLDLNLHREIHGDLALFRAAGGYSALPASKSIASVQPWEVWAALAIWEAFDYLDALDSLAAGKPKRPKFQWGAGSNIDQVMATSSARILADLAAEACSAYERGVAEAEVATYVDVARKANAEGLVAELESTKKQLEAESKELAQSLLGQAGAEALHSQPGGSRDKRAQILAIWRTGKYTTKTRCASEEHEALGMSYDTAMKALREPRKPKSSG